MGLIKLDKRLFKNVRYKTRKTKNIPRGVLLRGRNELILPLLMPSSVDSIITDPPYGINLMGKKWDYDVPPVETWKECLRVLKPGGHALIFAGSRTYHRMAVNVEDAGFFIKDTLMWLYGSGFPKSFNISKGIDKHFGVERTEGARVWSGGRSGNSICDATKRGQGTQSIIKYDTPSTEDGLIWNGWGTALKPSFEPIILAFKPNEETFADNALKWGVSGLNIAGSRVGDEKIKTNGKNAFEKWGMNACGKPLGGFSKQGIKSKIRKGRWPANVILDEEAARLLDEQTNPKQETIERMSLLDGFPEDPVKKGVSRFFYCAKPSIKEKGKYNTHITVKPVMLMDYLCNLLRTPKGGTVLDPFAGSGTTGVSCIRTGRPFILIEQGNSSCQIAKRRLRHQFILKKYG